jgi:hypothetical protein
MTGLWLAAALAAMCLAHDRLTGVHAYAPVFDLDFACTPVAIHENVRIPRLRVLRVFGLRIAVWTLRP